MAPLRGNKRKRKVENNEEEKSQEGFAEWWHVCHRKLMNEFKRIFCCKKCGVQTVMGRMKKESIQAVMGRREYVLIGPKNQGDPLASRVLGDFRSTFGMYRKTFNYICSLVKERMMSRAHFTFINGKQMSLQDQVALSLRRLGSGNSLIAIGDLFGAHHSTVSQVTWRFVEAIEEKQPLHLKWPSLEETSEIKRKFENIRGLPNCCGAIDTTHITMLLTSFDQEADCWLDRKEKHSMILQAIVDPEMRFRDIVVGRPGKMDESSVLQSSSFFKKCQNRENLNGRTIFLLEETAELGEYIIGDSAFPLLPWLITPYQGKELSESRIEFNERLQETHSVVRKALARLKERWKMIKGDMWRPDRHKLPRFILVCCILHNVIIDMEKDDDLEQVPNYVLHVPGYGQELCEGVDKNGAILRDMLSNYFCGR